MDKTNITSEHLSNFIKEMQSKYNNLLNDEVHYNLRGIYSNDNGEIITGYKIDKNKLTKANYDEYIQANNKQKCVMSKIGAVTMWGGFELLENYLALTFKRPITVESIKETIKNAYKCPITEKDIDDFFNLI